VGGNHNEIRLWRRRDSLKKTLVRRPDLLADAEITGEDRRMLEEIKADLNLN
jgi:tRNA (guanine37-N1)-methyltransferase